MVSADISQQTAGRRMAYPDKPQQQFSYTAFQQGQGDNSFPGTQLDNDLANQRASIEATIEFLRSALRSDGRVANGSIGREQLGAGVTLGFEPPTDWATGEAYAIGDTVFFDNRFYIAATEHTAGADFADDLAAGRWALLVNFAEATDDAEAARDAAQTAQGLAETARTGSETARDAAVAAQGLAEGARDDAQTARTGSETARDATFDARDLAFGARDDAQTARTGSETARDAAFDARDLAFGARDDAADSATAAAFSADEAASSAGFRDLKDVATLLANTSLEYGSGASQVQAGNIVRTREEGFAFYVADAAASDEDIETAGGVKLYRIASLGRPFASVEQAEASSVPDQITRISIIEGGRLREFYRDPDGNALQTNGGAVNWFELPSPSARFDLNDWMAWQFSSPDMNWPDIDGERWGLVLPADFHSGTRAEPVQPIPLGEGWLLPLRSAHPTSRVTSAGTSSTFSTLITTSLAYMDRDLNIREIAGGPIFDVPQYAWQGGRIGGGPVVQDPETRLWHHYLWCSNADVDVDGSSLPSPATDSGIRRIGHASSESLTPGSWTLDDTPFLTVDDANIKSWAGGGVNADRVYLQQVLYHDGEWLFFVQAGESSNYRVGVLVSTSPNVTPVDPGEGINPLLGDTDNPGGRWNGVQLGADGLWYALGNQGVLFSAPSPKGPFTNLGSKFTLGTVGPLSISPQAFFNTGDEWICMAGGRENGSTVGGVWARSNRRGGPSFVRYSPRVRTEEAVEFLAGRTDFFQSSTSPAIYRTALGAFDRFGDLVIQARSDVSRDIFFATGTTPTKRGAVTGNGTFQWGQTTQDQPGAGNTTTGAAIRNNGVISWSASASGSNANRNSNGIVLNIHRSGSSVGSISVTDSATAFNTSSDETLKDFTGEFSPADAYEIIKADPVRTFNWKADGQAAIGWGAQTSHAISPDLASPGGWVSAETGEPADAGAEGAVYQPWGVDQGKRTPYLWAAVAGLLARVEDLEKQIEAMKSAP